MNHVDIVEYYYRCLGFLIVFEKFRGNYRRSHSELFTM